MSKEHVRKSLYLSSACGSQFYSLHSGFALNLSASDLGNPDAQARREKIPHETACRIFMQSVRELAAYAARRQVRLLLENNVLPAEQVTPGEPHPLLMSEPAEIARFFEELNDPAVGLPLDAAHAKVAAASLGCASARFFKELTPDLGALHLSDTDGTRDTNRSFTSESWFAADLVRFRHLPQVIEVYRIDAAEIARQQAILSGWLGAAPG